MLTCCVENLKLFILRAFEALMMRANRDRRREPDELRLYRSLTGEFRFILGLLKGWSGWNLPAKLFTDFRRVLTLFRTRSFHPQLQRDEVKECLRVPSLLSSLQISLFQQPISISPLLQTIARSSVAPPGPDSWPRSLFHHPGGQRLLVGPARIKAAPLLCDSPDCSRQELQI